MNDFGERVERQVAEPAKNLVCRIFPSIPGMHQNYSEYHAVKGDLPNYSVYHIIMEKPPKNLLERVREAFLTHLVVEGQVAASTQNQAFNAILFLYREVLKQELEGRIDAIRAKRPQRLPVVLSPDETRAIIKNLSGVYRLLIQILYGSGLCLHECLELRVKDVDFQPSQLIIRQGKGGKDRIPPLPQAVVAPLQEQLLRVKSIAADEACAVL